MLNMVLPKFRHNFKEIQRDVVRRVHDNLDSNVHDILPVEEKTPALSDNVQDLFNHSEQNNNINRDTQLKRGKKRLAEREFIARPSLLTELFEVNHIRSIYHMFTAVLIITFIYNITNDVLSGAGIRLGLRYMHIGFGQFGWVLALWSYMFSATLAVYPLYCAWAKYRYITTTTTTTAAARLRWLWDRLWSLMLAVYLCAFITLPPYLKGYDMPMASAAIVLLEQTRLLMKIHAFVRSVTPHVLNNTAKPLPGFDRFLYFLFAPTFVYRDTYPRTKCVRWRFAAVCLLEVLGVILMFSLIAEHYLEPEFREFGVRQQTWSSLVTSVFRTMLPASLSMMCMFYIILHSWLNAWAEMLRFADRQFYKDWWNAANFGEYYRKWNVVVYDYLYEYVYRDVYVHCGTGGRVLASCAVFALSGLVHEYVIGFTLGFCYPILFVEFFGVGMALGFIKDNSAVGNVFLWTCIVIGAGIQYSFYSMELCARINCPQTDHTWLDVFVPRSWTCHGLTQQ